MELSPNDQLHGFTVLTREELPEIDGTAYVLSHRKSGARLLYLANDDANKVFSIAFKTSSPSRSRSWTCRRAPCRRS